MGGCLLPYACNYDPTAEYLLIETCDFDSCAGCTDTAACSYDPDATLSNLQDCDYPIDECGELWVDCDCECLNPSDYFYPDHFAQAGEVICDEDIIPGCINTDASNFNPFANVDDDTCVVPVYGCLLPWACNYDPEVTVYLAGSCDFDCLLECQWMAKLVQTRWLAITVWKVLVFTSRQTAASVPKLVAPTRLHATTTQKLW